MGTPKFSIPALEKLYENKFNILTVYTQPPKKSKRGQKINVSPIEEFCKKNKLSYRNPENLNNDQEYEFFKELSVDLAIVVAYGKIIPKNFLGLPTLGFINIHASLLPKWRGAAPIQRAIINQDETIGVSIMKIQEKLDSGPVLISKKINLDPKLIYGEIEEKLSIIGSDLLIESLKSITNRNAKFLNQIHADATYAKKINKNETKINWNLNANKVVAHIHGLSPRPGAWFNYKNERFKILRAKKSTLKGNPGNVLNEKLTVACQSESIQVLEIQREGRKKQSVKDFLIGNKIAKDTVLS